MQWTPEIYLRVQCAGNKRICIFVETLVGEPGSVVTGEGGEPPSQVGQLGEVRKVPFEFGKSDSKCAKKTHFACFYDSN